MKQLDYDTYYLNLLRLRDNALKGIETGLEDAQRLADTMNALIDEYKDIAIPLYKKQPVLPKRVGLFDNAYKGMYMQAEVVWLAFGKHLWHKLIGMSKDSLTPNTFKYYIYRAMHQDIMRLIKPGAVQSEVASNDTPPILQTINEPKL